jgi:hypothetical protein
MEKMNRAMVYAGRRLGHSHMTTTLQVYTLPVEVLSDKP